MYGRSIPTATRSGRGVRFPISAGGMSNRHSRGVFAASRPYTRNRVSITPAVQSGDIVCPYCEGEGTATRSAW